MESKQCTVDGCTGWARARGWCVKHYTRWQKWGDPLKTTFERASLPVSGRCSIPGCERPAWTKGWCNTHYQRWRQSGNPEVVKTVPHVLGKICSIEGCGGKHAGKGYCQRHYDAFKRWGDPLGERHRSLRNLDLEAQVILETLDLQRVRHDEHGQWWIRKGSGWDKATAFRCRGCPQIFIGRADLRPQYCGTACQSKAHSAHMRKKRNGQPGGKHVGSDGYVWVYYPEHPNATKNGAVKEHRIVMEQQLGRYLEPWEQVHHMNADRTDNRPDNLELWLRKQPTGARLSDLLDFVVLHYTPLLLERIDRCAGCTDLSA